MSSTSSKSRAPEAASGELCWQGERLVEVGRIGGPHGVRGEVRFRPFNQRSTAVERVRQVFIVDEGAARPAVVEGARAHGDVWLLRLAGTATPEQAKSLAGRRIAVRERDLEPLAANEFYHYQLVGLAVTTEAGEALGVVREVLSAAGNDVLAVADGDTERLIPLGGEAIRSVDLEAGRIVVRPLEGLFEP